MLNIKTVQIPYFGSDIVKVQAKAKTAAPVDFLPTEDKFREVNKPKDEEFEPEEKKKKRINRLGLSIGVTTVLSGAAILFLLKGNKGKFLEKLKNKMNDMKLKERVGNVADNTSNIGYKIFKNTEQAFLKTLGIFDIINNANTFKDVLMKKLMHSSFGLKKLFPKFEVGKYINDKITDFFVFIGKKSVFRSYNKSKLKMLPNLPETSDIKQIANRIYDNVHIRLNSVDDVANNIYNDIGSHMKGTFWSKSTFTEFIANREMTKGMSSKIKNELDVKTLRKQLSYSRNDKIKNVEQELMNVVNDISIKDSESLKILKSIRRDLKKIGTNDEKNIIENVHLLYTNIEKKTDSASKEILPKIKKLEEAVTCRDEGAIQKYLFEMKKGGYTKEAIAETEKAFDDWISSLDKAISLESKDYVEKMRDLALGSAFTDILTFLGSLFTLSYFLSKCENASDRESILLKYGFPALGGLGVSLYSNAKLVSGTKSLLVGGVAMLVFNKIGELLEKTVKKDENSMPAKTTQNQTEKDITQEDVKEKKVAF